MSDFGDYSDDDDDDQDWLYVEDHYDEVDELAEHTCPSPIVGESHEYQEYDPYDYWEDLAYLSDGAYDNEGKKKSAEKKTTLELAGKKRKRGAEHVAPTAKCARTGKKSKGSSRRTAPHDHSPATADSIVFWVPQEQRDNWTIGDSLVRQSTAYRVSVLKDWKDRIHDDPTSLALSNPTTTTDGLADHGGGDEDEPGNESNEDEEETMLMDEHGPEASDSLDLGNISSIAELLARHPDAIGNIAKANGLDLDAVQLVLQDLIGGTHREFDEEEERKDDEGPDADGGGEDDVTGAELDCVKLVEQTPADPQKETDPVNIIPKRAISPEEQLPKVVKAARGAGSTKYSSFRLVRQSGLPNKKARKN